jgi:hypothetical protein
MQTRIGMTQCVIKSGESSIGHMIDIDALPNTQSIEDEGLTNGWFETILSPI